jgi:long-subunit acyl-CoA synthetase (AMP-forming)
MQYCLEKKINLEPSYSCIIGGAPSSIHLWKSIQNKLFIEKPSIGYGCTEASPGITHHPPGQIPLEDNEIGYPLKSIESKIVSHQGVLVSGDALCSAIYENNQITYPHEILIKDLISCRSDQMWVYQGRSDFILNRGGEKFSLEIIESLIYRELQVPALALALVDKRLGRDLGLLLLKNTFN